MSVALQIPLQEDVQTDVHSERLCPGSAPQHSREAWKALPEPRGMQQRGFESPVEVVLAAEITYSLCFSLCAMRQGRALREGAPEGGRRRAWPRSGAPGAACATGRQCGARAARLVPHRRRSGSSSASRESEVQRLAELLLAGCSLERRFVFSTYFSASAGGGFVVKAQPKEQRGRLLWVSLAKPFSCPVVVFIYSLI